MMWFLSVLVIVVPAALGALALRFFLPRSVNMAVCIGYGYPLGIGGAIGFFYLLAIFQGGFHPWPVVLVSFIGVVLFALLIWRRARLSGADETFDGHHSAPSAVFGNPFRYVSWYGLLVLVFSVAAVFHVVGVFIEVSMLPLYSWDAFIAWSLKAKVMFLHGELIEFVSPEQWLQADGGDFFYAAGHDYPLFVSLLQVWVASAIGEWHESYVNLPWAFLYLSGALALYGQLRCWRVGLLFSLVPVYLMLSLPLVGVHAFLSGYADLWLSLVFGMVAIAFLAALIDRQRWQWALVVALLPLLLVIKNSLPTLLVLVMLLPMAWVACWYWSRWLFWTVTLFGLGGLVLCVALDFCVSHLDMRGLAAYLPDWSRVPDVARIMFAGVLVHASWHLFFVLGVVSVVAASSTRLWGFPAHRALIAFFVGSLLVFMLGYSGEASFSNVENFTVTNRGLLYMVMPVMFWFGLVIRDLFGVDVNYANSGARLG